MYFGIAAILLLASPLVRIPFWRCKKEISSFAKRKGNAATWVEPLIDYKVISNVLQVAFGSPVFFGSQPLPPPPYGDYFYDYDGYGYGTLDLPKFMPTKTREGQRFLGNNGMQFSLNGSVSTLWRRKAQFDQIIFFSSFKHIGANGSPGLSALALAGMDSKNGTDTAFIHQVGTESSA